DLLKPYTDSLPKPLFPLGGQPILERTIRQLIDGGCDAVVVNTHHLHEQIETFISKQRFGISVTTRYEPEILETGGAIRNVRDFLGDDPFMVVNSDIVTDMDYAEIHAFHKSHGCPVTLVLHDFAEFNNVTIDKGGFVLGFHLKEKPHGAVKDLAFTGVQVIDPSVIPLIPKGPSSSIDLYRKLIENGQHVKAMILKDRYWMDVGSPSKYSEVCRDFTAPTLFRKIFDTKTVSPVSVTHLSGDGSDRAFYRLENQGNSMILADHGITLGAPVCEAASFERIGRHLLSKGVPVPQIYWSDLFAGQVYLEDLGDIHLETAFKQGNSKKSIALYKDALKNLARMSVKGAINFKPEWAFQTNRYDKTLIIERECQYFIQAFVKGYLGLDVDPEDLLEDFSNLADHALMYAYDGLMLRDFQSRNIMVKDNRCYFIDFQSGRLGPVQYDLASLLIDPYTGLPHNVQDLLVDYFIGIYSELTPVVVEEFLESYRYLKITRNLQMLGAFGFLSRVKGKTQFEDHIPKAVANLKYHVSQTDDKLLKKLKKIVDKI
ncbi:MAG: sugar phosphate nucleotidyltransferase, partial [Desulfobacteraceae bacterium]